MGHGLRITAGAFKGRTLKTAEGPGYRPATARVREALFSMLDARGVQWRECFVLDLFAGSGSLGFEALSRGARAAWFVESDAKAAALIKKNAATLGLDAGRVAVLAKDIHQVLPRRHELGAPRFGVIFIDPPYGKGMLHRAVKNVLHHDWPQEGALVVSEVEGSMELDPETLHPRLDLLADRRYGQSRITVWQTTGTTPETTSPSTPEPSTP